MDKKQPIKAFDFDASAKSGCVRIILNGKEKELFFDAASASTLKVISGIGKKADEFQLYMNGHPVKKDGKASIYAYDDTAQRFVQLCDDCTAGFRKIFGKQFDDTFGKDATIDDLNAIKYFVVGVSSQITVFKAEQKASETAEGEV